MSPPLTIANEKSGWDDIPMNTLRMVGASTSTAPMTSLPPLRAGNAYRMEPPTAIVPLTPVGEIGILSRITPIVIPREIIILNTRVVPRHKRMIAGTETELQQRKTVTPPRKIGTS